VFYRKILIDLPINLNFHLLVMRKTYLTIVVAALLSAVSLNSAFANGSPVTLNSVVNLSITGSFWQGPYYMSSLTVRATNELQATDTSNEVLGLLAGGVTRNRLGNKNILSGSKGRLVAVWAGPDNGPYPYLASLEKGKDPSKIEGWSISSRYISDPFDTVSTVNGAIRIKQSPSLWVPATDNLSVPADQKRASGYTGFTFGIKDTTPQDAISGWGTYTADFKKLFTGKARLSGSVDYYPPLN